MESQEKIEVPVCLVGSITRIPDGADICMDGATHYLNGAAPSPIRLKATNDGAKKDLETFTDAKVLVQVCGYHREVECHRLDVYHVDIAREEVAEMKELPAAQSCRLIPFTNAEVVAGFVNDTFFLHADGEAPCGNMSVSLIPRVYVQQPEYWGIEVVGCVSGGVCIRSVKPWDETIPLEGIRGTKGIEVIGANSSKKFDIPGSISSPVISSGGNTDIQSPLLANADQITGQQVPGVVLLTASGMKPTPGHQVKFEVTELDVFPPEYRLVQTPPTGPVAQVITPFRVSAQFRSEDLIETVIVHDANGRNEVSIEKVLD